MNKLLVAGLIIVGLAVAGFVIYRKSHQDPTSTPIGSAPPSVAKVFSSSDEFNDELATRVRDQLHTNGASDFKVGVTPVVDPIGTLYPTSRSVPYDDTSCLPPMEPALRDMPSVFPHYQLTGKLAAELGIDDAVLKGAANATATVAIGSAFDFSVDSPQMKVLSDTAIKNLLATPKCAMTLKSGLQIVRGYVNGQRKFTTKADLTATAKVGVQSVGKFNAEVSTVGLLSIGDPAPRGFLQVLSEVVVVAAVAPATTPAPAGLTEPKPVAGIGHVYIQQDRSDDAWKGDQVRDLLKNAGFKVDSRVERTSSAHTPDTPQVRFFNTEDETGAKSVLERFKIKYPSAVLAPMAIPAPKGQVEVWLPRTGKVAKPST